LVLQYLTILSFRELVCHSTYWFSYSKQFLLFYWLYS